MPEYWQKFVRIVTDMLADNFAKVESVAKEIPTYYVRYEDLILDPTRVISELFRFLLGVSKIEGTVLEKRIVEKIQPNNEVLKRFNVNTQDNNLNKNKDMYSY